MIKKKTIAIKQDVKGMIIRGISDMTPAELAKVQATVKQVLASKTLEGFLSQIGRVYEVPFSDGRSTFSVILTYEGIKGLGIDLNTVFKGCGGGEEFNESIDVKNGVLVNLDLHQQVALLRAIIEKKQELANILGLYNLRGSRKVYEVLIREGVSRQLNIWWMWTGERFVPRQDEEDYPEEGIVTLGSIEQLEGGRFVGRSVGDGIWSDGTPADHYSDGAVVLGAQW